MKNLIIDGNTKMGKEVAIFNLPPKKTCTPSKWCLCGKDGKPACYALRNQFCWPNVQKALAWRFEESKKDSFVSRMIKEIQKKGTRFFRIHASGDFYSKEYIQKWEEIAEACPNTIFRSTTRRKDLQKEVKKFASMPNVIIRESLDSEKQKPTMGLPFAAISTLPIAKKTFKCENHCPTCNYKCWKRRINMQFDEH